MPQDVLILLGSAAGIGLVHTLIGPDHYIPFIVLARARGWSLPRTLWITVLCGLGHVAASAVLGLVGIAAGVSLRWLTLIESQRGEIAAWLLMGFGLAYAVWGALGTLRRRAHVHSHAHLDGTVHRHSHAHAGAHLHPHGAAQGNLTPWVLFTIFVFGPCEPLVPLLMYPAAAASAWSVFLVTAVFGGVTIATMTAVVALSAFGLSFVSIERLGRHRHTLAGATVFLCGAAIRVGL